MGAGKSPFPKSPFSTVSNVLVPNSYVSLCCESGYDVSL